MDQAIINGLAEGSVYALLAVGLVFINRITEVASFAHGEVSAFAAFVGFTVFHSVGAPFLVAIACSVIAGALLCSTRLGDDPASCATMITGNPIVKMATPKPRCQNF